MSSPCIEVSDSLELCLFGCGPNTVVTHRRGNQIKPDVVKEAVVSKDWTLHSDKGASNAEERRGVSMDMVKSRMNGWVTRAARSTRKRSHSYADIPFFAPQQIPTRRDLPGA